MNPIHTAVAPLKADAIVRAEQEAQKIVAHVAAQLAAHDFNLNATAPYPKTYGSTRDYAVAKATHNLYVSLTTVDEERNPRYGAAPAAYYVKMRNARIARFIAQAQEDAAAQYDAFVAKLTHKIGDCDSATLEGNHVWGHSLLTVTKANVTEKWKTRQIVNTSKLGRLFNQWPTRKVK